MSDEPKSDLFKLDEVDRRLEPVTEVLTPPEVLRRQRLRRTIAIVISVLLAAATAWVVHHFVHASAVESAALAAGDTGRASDVREALATLGAGEAPGLRARLEAMLAWAGEGELAVAEAALAAVPDDEGEASERLKAETYVALAQGDLSRASQAAERLIARGTFAAETAHARSLAAFHAGDPARALVEARAASGVREGAPRYTAQVALSAAYAGDVDGALTALEGVDRGAPEVLFARALVLMRARRAGGDEAAAALAAHEASTPRERAWATLVEAWSASLAGERERARGVLMSDTGLLAAPPGDAEHRWRVAEILLRAGDVETARAAIAGLEQVGADPALAGRVRAWLALEGEGPEAALAVLSTVPASPDALLLVGRAHERRGAPAEAAAAYERGAQSEGWAAEGLSAGAALATSQGDRERARTLARRALESTPTHPAHVAIAVAALVPDEAADALGLAEAALARHPDDDRLLVARAEALYALERWDAAREAFAAALAKRPEDVALHAQRGDAARRAGQPGEAREAFDAALARAPTDPLALTGRFLLDVEEHRLDDAATLLDRVAALRDVGDQVWLARARFHVGYGSGLSGMRDVNRAMRERGLRGNAELRVIVAELQLQGELYRPAVGMFEQARRLGADPVEMALAKALAHALDGRGNLSTQQIQVALEGSAVEGGEPAAASHPRLLVVRGRIELNLGRFGAAQRYAERALDARPGDTEASLLLAEALMRTRGDPSAALRAAAGYPRAQPMAFAHLATRAGATPEGCAYAARYLAATGRNAKYADAMQALRERCAAE
ncbi:MAG: tetratricopeptide repeat protein [Myxococcales bacterium]|nr:tetratricopeptide repeat protein [Myxococcales bacterium]